MFYMLSVCCVAKKKMTITTHQIITIPLFFAIAFMLKASALPPTIKIGAIFSEDQKGSALELAFKYSVYKINNDKSILPHTTLVSDIQYVPRDDSFHASKIVCSQVKMGVYAIFGPSDPIIGTHIQSICDALDIPHFESRIYDDQTPSTDTQNAKEFSINIQPAQQYVNEAFRDMITYLNWTVMAVIYEDNYGLVKLRELVRDHNRDVLIYHADSTNFVRVLNEIKNKDIYNLIVDTKAEHMKDFLKAILQLQMNEYKYHYLFTTFDIDTFDLEDFKYNFVNITAFRLVNTEDVSVRQILKDMQRYNFTQNKSGNDLILRSKYIDAESALMYDAVHIFAIGLQTLEQSHTIELSKVSCLEENPWNGGLSLINYINAVEWKGITGPIELKEGRRIQFKLELVKLKQHSIVKVGEWSPQIGLNISDNSVFFDIGKINVTLVVITILEIPYVMMHYGKNVTGNERFFGFCVDILDRVANEVGFDYILDLVPDRKYGAKDPITGEWNGMVAQLMKHEPPYVMLRTPKNIPLIRQSRKETKLSLKNVTARNSLSSTNQKFHRRIRSIDQNITEYLSLPEQEEMSSDNDNDHIKLAEDPMENDGKDLYEGFCIDLLRKISETVGFDYRIELVPDGKYGVFDYDTGEWNGIVRQLMDKKADLAVGSMTINYARESVIDFTKPFMNLGISILFKVPASQPTRLFSFMNPFTVDIWLYVLAAYCLVSITIYIVARFSPQEWHNPHPCDTDNNMIENPFTISNSFWFAIGTLMQQGSDLNPRATSTRIVGGVWWFFTLIMISSYTANLAAFLTVERMITPIENAEDLAGQTEITYGTLESGSTMTFFRDSMVETYKKMWRFMENRSPPVFTSTYEEGIRRVLEGNYAFLMESTMLDYIVQRNCNLTQIGGLLDTKGYGIATPMGSMWRDEISLSILELQEKGEIQMLYDKWWKNSGDTCVRPDETREPNRSASSLNVDNIGGIFVVLLCGLSIAIIIAICEFCYNSKKINFVEQNVLLDEDINPLAIIGGKTDDNNRAGTIVRRQFVIPARQSLCAEMAEEFCFAIRCNGSRQRPALKRTCSRCLHNNYRIELKSEYGSSNHCSMPSLTTDIDQHIASQMMSTDTYVMSQNVMTDQQTKITTTAIEYHNKCDCKQDNEEM